jgi:hypothetical protein
MSDYYDGGHKATIAGAPVRLARKPSATALEVLRGRSGTKALRDAESVRHPETTYDPVAVWSERRCAKCGARSDDPSHGKDAAHKFEGAWRYLRSVGGVRDPRAFSTAEEARRG